MKIGIQFFDEPQSIFDVIQNKEREGAIIHCKGGSTSSSSKPLDLDQYMKSTLYPDLQKQYSYLANQYPAAPAFEDWLSSNREQQGIIQSGITGAQGSLGNLANLTSSLMTPESYSQAMQPYLNKAYQGIGYSGMPSGSYVDKTLAEATQQGFMSNLSNILGASQAEQSQRSQVADLANSLNTLTGQEYGAITEPLDFIKAIQSGRYNQSVQKSSQSGGGGLLSMFG
jgi:hypothetical protein